MVNVSVEKKDDADGKLTGYVRIRSKTQVRAFVSKRSSLVMLYLDSLQGIALSLGDRITLVQRGTSSKTETADQQP